MGFTVDNTLNAVEIAKRKRIASQKGLIDLTESNPTKCGLFFPPDILQNAICEYISKRVYRPDSKGLLESRQAIADYYALRSPNLGIKPEQIVITASTSEAYRLLFSLLCEPGDNLLAPDVTYPLFEYFATDQRVNLHNYRILEGRNWEIDPFSLDVAFDKRTRGILMVSPHNPTGKIQYKRDEAVAALAMPIISDEVFSEFLHKAERMPAVGELYQELPVFHLNGISKMFALPDLKLGWIAMNSAAYEKYAERLELLNDTYLSASSLTQAVLPSLFKQGTEFQNEMTKRVDKNVHYVYDFLKLHGFKNVYIPDGGTFILAGLPDGLDEEAFVIKVIESGVYLHPGYFYNVPNEHIMISCLLEESILENGLKIIAGCL